MINQIKKLYSQCDQSNCHEEFNVSFFIHDHNSGKCEASILNTNATCFIENLHLENIDFIAIDECLIPSHETMKCDAVVIKENVIWFIELKEVDWSTNSTLNRKKRSNARKKAVKQLAATINHFKISGINLSEYLIAGLISFPPFTQPTPTVVPSTSSQARILEFVDLCGYSELHEGNHLAL